MVADDLGSERVAVTGFEIDLFSVDDQLGEHAGHGLGAGIGDLRADLHRAVDAQNRRLNIHGRNRDITHLRIG